MGPRDLCPEQPRHQGGARKPQKDWASRGGRGSGKTPWRRRGPWPCRAEVGPREPPPRPRPAHLQVGEVPGAVVFLPAHPGEGGPEVHLDQLPVGAVADVAEDAGGKGQENALFAPVPSSPQASAPACTEGPATPLLPSPGHPGTAAASDASPAQARLSRLLPAPACLGTRSSLCSVPASRSQVPTGNSNNSNNGNSNSKNCRLERWKGAVARRQLGLSVAPLNSQVIWARNGCP